MFQFVTLPLPVAYYVECYFALCFALLASAGSCFGIAVMFLALFELSIHAGNLYYNNIII